MKNVSIDKIKNNISVINTSNGVNINLTITQPIAEDFSLKNILRNNIKGAVCIETLNIKICLQENASINIVDDLLDFDITKSSIEFTLNKNSELNYDLRILDLENINETSDGLLMSYNQQGFFEKQILFSFLGENSKAKAKCIVKGSGNRLFKFKTIQDHKVSNTKSDLVIKGAFCQNSKLVCDNLIKVDKKAQKVEVSQVNKNLLLGCNSQAISIPKLEVQADDVSCKHGAAVSKLDDEQIFYLQSRGMNHCDAKNLLVDAFLN